MRQPRGRDGQFRKRRPGDKAPAQKEATIADLLKPRAIAPTLKRHQPRRTEHDAETKLQLVRDAQRGAERHEANDAVRHLKRAVREDRMAIALLAIALAAAQELRCLNAETASEDGRAPIPGP